MAINEARTDDFGPIRKQSTFTIADTKLGRVQFKTIDRISIDDLTEHLIIRELYRLAGGKDPGEDVPTVYKDFLIREGYFQR